MEAAPFFRPWEIGYLWSQRTALSGQYHLAFLHVGGRGFMLIALGAWRGGLTRVQKPSSAPLAPAFGVPGVA